MSRSDYRRVFGERVRELRQEKGWTSQEAFANHADIDRTYVSSIERGRRNPTLGLIVKLAHGLDVRPADLLKTLE